MRALHLFACCLLGLPAFGFLRVPRFHAFVHLSASSSGTDQLSGSSISIGSTEKPAGSDDGSLTGKPVLGRPHTATSRAKIAAKNKGKVPWNVGKAHSDETRKLIAEKTREAMLRRKLEKLDALGMTLEDYEQERVQRKRERKQALRTGLTIEGRRRISESVKRRWQDPEFRRHYTVTNRGARNHSEATRAKISEAITLKWKDVDYRAKVRRNPTLEERARISATLKLKWRDPEFRDRMLNHSFPRTDEWRNLVSEKIREKWQDPTYRESVTSAIRASNRTGPSGSGGKVRLRPSRAPTPRRPRQSPDEVKARKRAARQALKEKNTARKEAFKVAKQAAQRSGGSTRLKELLGRELWFEEKMKRRGKGDALLDDESLEKQLAAEMGQEDEDDEEDEDLDDDEDDDDDDDDDDDLYDDDDDGGGGTGTFSGDVIEVYDEDGNLVGEYTDEEWEQLRKVRAGS